MRFRSVANLSLKVLYADLKAGNGRELDGSPPSKKATQQTPATSEYLNVTAEIGHYALILSLAAALLGGVLPLAGSFLGLSGWMRTGRAAAASLALTGTIAIAALAYAFVTSDFSVINVARNSNAALPWFYKFAAVWGSHEGSVLFWVVTLCWWTFAVSLSARNLPERVLARILGTLNLISFGLFLFILLTSNPFLRLFPPPADGSDLNPLLQDPGMIFHPPMLYLGYVGFAVPFAFAVAALMGGKLDAAWARWMRPWTAASWVLLTLGISLGSYWSYYELGWGGWWAWDPVENSSLMPWLTGTALMHSIAVTQKRGVFKIWTVFLAILTLSLSLLGMFLVRSGVLTSVHAFASDPKRGAFILVFLSIVIGVSFLLFAWKGTSVKTRGTFTWCSRESALFANNLILVAGMGTVLLGTLYPLFLDALGGGKISVGAPYFNTVFGMTMIPMALLLAPGAVSAWREDGAAALARRMVPGAVIGLALVAWVWVMMGEMTFVALVGAFLTGWIAGGIFEDLVRFGRTRLRQGLNPILQPAQRWATHLAHFGVALLIFGAALVSSFEIERNVTMYPGDVVTIRDATFRYNSWAEYRGPNYTGAKGSITILNRSGEEVAELNPEKRNYDAVEQMTMTEAAITHRWNEDVYVSMGTPTPDGNGWVIRAYVKPFVMLIWIGTLFMALGGVFALFDRPHRENNRREVRHA